ncbi:serine protease [Arthrobacter cupressi]|uniref:Serine protease n=1 Tax=Arthrobacter cupressi TaxID=1045773 RepID=A0A1G8UL05_9MICC|nr:serine protease [Arthrobacter cupressi]
MLSLAAPQTTFAASDISAPVLVSSSVTPQSLDIATGPTTAKVTVRLTDQTGTQAPTLIASHDESGQTQGFGSMTLVSGTVQDGIWERSITIPEGSATGAWTVTLYPLRDTLGNNSSSFQYLATLTVIGAVSDVAGPVLVSSSVTPQSLDIATGPATAKVTVRLTDQTGTQAPTLITSHDESGQTQGFGGMTLVSGTVQDGIWERSITIPEGSATGTWTVTLYPLRDTLGNNTTGFKDLATLNITGAVSDTAAPVLASSSVTPQALDIATGPATAKVSVRLTDQTGTQAPTLIASHDQSGQTQGFGSMTLVSGTAQDGTWERSITIPQGSATGSWTITLYPLRDTLGNNTSSFQDLATLTVSATAPDLPLTVAPMPTISGTTKVGYTLTAVPGTWSPAPVTLSYQWYRSGTPITAATATSYKLTASDAGKPITVRVTGRKTGYTAAAKTSSPTVSVVR